jgi:hypothetical protein
MGVGTGSERHLKLAKKTECNIVKGGDAKYRPHCEGHRFKDGSTPWPNEIHHILCEHAIKAFDIEKIPWEDFLYIKRCLHITPWDINQADNLIGLPTKIGLRSKVHRPAILPLNRPCHQVDHNTAKGYTVEVKDWLHTNVWNSLKAAKDAHKVDEKSIKEQLDNGVKHFARVVKKRGERGGGTDICYRNRFETAYKKRWYRPFSMGKKPTELSPGGRNEPQVFTAIR